MEGYVGKIEQVVPVDFPLLVDGGSPFPILLQSELRCILVFDLLILNETDPLTGVLTFQDCLGVFVNGFSEESRSKHHLYRRGLSEISFIGEVVNSSWVAQVGVVATSRTSSSQGNVRALSKHFIMVFHDSVIECIACGIDVESSPLSQTKLVSTLVQQLYNPSR